MSLDRLVLLILVSVSSTFAQDIGTTEIKVTEGFAPKIPDAFRLNRNASFADTLKKDRAQIYELFDTNLNSDYKTKPLAAAIVKDDKIPQLIGSQIGIGFGSNWITNASILHNSKRSKTFSYGVVANHFSNKYQFSENSKNSLLLYRKKISSSYIFLSDLVYDRRTASYYDEEKYRGLDNFFRNRFAYTKLSLSVVSKQKSSQELKHHTVFFVSDLNELSENQIHLSSNLSKIIKGSPYALKIAFNDYLGYNNPNSKVNNTDLKWLAFSPATSFTKYDVDFNLAIDVDFVSNNSSISFFPQFKATKVLVEDILLISGGLLHTKHRTSIKSLSDENPYIHSFGLNQSILEDSNFLQELKITTNKELYLSMQNMLSSDEIFEVSIAYGTVSNFVNFISIDHQVYSRFNALYLDVMQLHINTNYSRKINDIISMTANADYFSWDEDVYHKPNFIVNLSSLANLRDKIKASFTLDFFGERRLRSSYWPEIEPSVLPAHINANIGLYYSYSNQISGYLKLNNLTNSKEDLWLGYPDIGFNVSFGVSFSF